MINVTVVGNVGRSELRFTTAGKPVLEFSVASTVRAKDKPEHTTWVRCVLWGPRAEALSKHVDKGSSVAVSGSLALMEYEKKDGSKGFSLECTVNDLAFTGGKRDGGERAESRQAPPRGGAGPAKPAAPADAGGSGEADDDLPFLAPAQGWERV